MMDKGKKGFWFVRMVIFGALFMLGMGYVVMLLWNWLIPSIIGWKSVTFIQALGLLLLCKILFGFGGSSGWRGGHHPKHRWKHKMREKWNNMSDEEREAFKTKMRGKWKHWNKE